MDSCENIQALIKSCLLPNLSQDLDSIAIEKEQFKIYHEHLQLQLPILYDWIQQQPDNCLKGAEKTQLEACLIILLCEVASPKSIFKLDNQDLTRNAVRILENYGRLSQEVDEIVFSYYEEKLHKNNWKRELGPVHGFVKYLELRFKDAKDYDRSMSQKFHTFCLSVALNVRSCYETHYKCLSTTIFLTMLEYAAYDDILSMNIHSVIYDAVFKDIHMMDSVPFVMKQWNCLIKSLNYYRDFDSFSWNYLDDMMEVLIRNVSLAPDSSTSICLVKFVSKLLVHYTINHKEFEEKLNTDLAHLTNITELRLLSSTNTSYTCYRWSKNILQMFIIESHKLMQTPDICKQMLKEVHGCYMVGILPIGLTIIAPHLITFLEKFIAVLMEVVKAQNYQEDVLQAITYLLETFYYHLKDCDDESLKLFKFKHAIYNLIKMDTFKKYSSV